MEKFATPLLDTARNHPGNFATVSLLVASFFRRRNTHEKKERKKESNLEYMLEH